MNERKTYYGAWTVNNGQTFCTPMTWTNKKEAAKDLRRMANGNLTGPTSTGIWSVWTQDQDGERTPVDSGTVEW